VLNGNEKPGVSRGRGGWLRRFGPVTVLVLAIATVFVFGLQDYLTFDALRDNRMFLMQIVEEYTVLSVITFIAIYAISTALSLPGGAILSVAGGFLFGWLLGGISVVVGATIGATAVFLIAKTALGTTLEKKAGPFIKRLEAGFRENALSYLLVLRLIPIFPFFIVNLVPAFLGVPLGIYVIGTFFGIIPGSLVFSVAGAGLGSVFDSGAQFSAVSVFTPEVIAALAGLSLLSLLPVAYKKLAARKI